MMPRRPARLLSLAAITLVSLALAPQPQPAPAAAGPTVSSERTLLSGIRPEGRLRKLHLVRPDLIPYPIAYEVYC